MPKEQGSEEAGLLENAACHAGAFFPHSGQGEADGRPERGYEQWGQELDTRAVRRRCRQRKVVGMATHERRIQIGRANPRYG